MLPLHEPHAGVVDQERALAADRLADQRLLTARARTEPRDRRVELDELEIAHDRAGPQRGGHAVAGRHARVRGGRVHLPEAAGGEHHRPRPHRADAVALPLAHDVQRQSGDRAGGVVQQIEQQRVLDHLHPGRVQRAGDERPLDLGAGRVAAGVRDAVAQVAALAGE